jgi:hypothetical protein
MHLGLYPPPNYGKATLTAHNPERLKGLDWTAKFGRAFAEARGKRNHR